MRVLAFLIHPKIKDCVIDLKTYLNRVIKMEINLQGKDSVTVLLLLLRMLAGDACCPHDGGRPPQLLQVAIELVSQKRRFRPCAPPHSIM